MAVNRREFGTTLVASLLTGGALGHDGLGTRGLQGVISGVTGIALVDKDGNIIRMQQIWEKSPKVLYPGDQVNVQIAII